MRKIVLAFVISMFASKVLASEVTVTKPEPQTNSQTVSAMDEDRSCERSSHRSHKHCSQPRIKIRHEGEVRRNGRLISGSGDSDNR